MTQLAGASDWPGNVLWILTGLVWLTTLAAYVANITRQHRWSTALSDPTFGPFAALIVIVPMLLAVALARQAGQRCGRDRIRVRGRIDSALRRLDLRGLDHPAR